ncbi:unnamed protein product, partial [Ectocarpus fasciculatus]
ARSGLLIFESGDRAFSPAKLADVAQAVQFNYSEADRRLVMEVAAAAAIALPVGCTIQAAVDIANDHRPDLRDLVRDLLAAMRRATLHASSPVVWPGCGAAVLGMDGFAVPKGRKKSSKATGSSGDESGWSSTGASRPPKERAAAGGDGRSRQSAKRHTSGSRSGS